MQIADISVGTCYKLIHHKNGCRRLPTQQISVSQCDKHAAKTARFMPKSCCNRCYRYAKSCLCSNFAQLLHTAGTRPLHRCGCTLRGLLNLCASEDGPLYAALSYGVYEECERTFALLALWRGSAIQTPPSSFTVSHSLPFVSCSKAKSTLVQ